MRNFGTGMLFASSIILSQWSLAQPLDEKVTSQDAQGITNWTSVLVGSIIATPHLRYDIPVMAEPEVSSHPVSGFNLGLVDNNVVLWHTFPSKGIIPYSTGILGIGLGGQKVKGDTLNLWGDSMFVQAKIIF